MPRCCWGTERHRRQAADSQFLGGAYCLSLLGGLALERLRNPGAARRVVDDSRSTPLSPPGGTRATVPCTSNDDQEHCVRHRAPPHVRDSFWTRIRSKHYVCRISCRLQRWGSLVHDITLQLDLPKCNPGPEHRPAAGFTGIFQGAPWSRFTGIFPVAAVGALWSRTSPCSWEHPRKAGIPHTPSHVNTHILLLLTLFA